MKRQLELSVAVFFAERKRIDVEQKTTGSNFGGSKNRFNLGLTLIEQTLIPIFADGQKNTLPTGKKTLPTDEKKVA